MPQLNPEFFVSQLFWLVVFFSFLLVFLWRVSLPRIASVLEKRQNKIDEYLSSAKELQIESQEIEKRINDQISSAKQDTDEQIRNTVSSLQNEVSSQLLSIDKELEDKIANSEKEILKNRDNQMKDIGIEISNITKITVAKISDLKLTDDTISQAIKNYKETLN